MVLWAYISYFIIFWHRLIRFFTFSPKVTRAPGSYRVGPVCTPDRSGLNFVFELFIGSWSTSFHIFSVVFSKVSWVHLVTSWPMWTHFGEFLGSFWRVGLRALHWTVLGQCPKLQRKFNLAPIHRHPFGHLLGPLIGLEQVKGQSNLIGSWSTKATMEHGSGKAPYGTNYPY